ncbi:MAG: Holliday junction branch migration protein RuvA [Bacteroidales bacterium]|nr:Holliday junction branch migration protein RuvA [Bacteroidales bacterium]
MTDYISGKVEELNPTQVVIDNNGIGYRMEISLQTYAMLDGKTQAKVYIQTIVNTRDGGSVEYGFANKDERALFQLITSVSGVGAASARMILSSFSAEEFRQAVLAENVNMIKSVKGLGLKTAQRLILELKDKIADGGGSDSAALFTVTSNEVIDEASSALIMLGFNKANVQKAIQQILKQQPNARVEDIIKAALKML